MTTLTYAEIGAAGARIGDRIRRVVVAPADPGELVPGDAGGRCKVYLALEFMQHTGTFKARGALNFIRAQREAGSLHEQGITIASGGNAGLACAWAARDQGVRATVFVPETAPTVKILRLESYGADVRLVGSDYAEALAACHDFAATTGALASHAYDHPLIAAGAGTLLLELRDQIPGLDVVVVAVGGGGLFSGVATAARHHGIRTIAVEPENCRALNAAVQAGRVVDVPVDSVAADSLGARRASEMALHQPTTRPSDRSSSLTPRSSPLGKPFGIIAAWRSSMLQGQPSLDSSAQSATVPPPGRRSASFSAGPIPIPSTLRCRQPRGPLGKRVQEFSSVGKDRSRVPGRRLRR